MRPSPLSRPFTASPIDYLAGRRQVAYGHNSVFLLVFPGKNSLVKGKMAVAGYTVVAGTAIGHQTSLLTQAWQSL